VRINATQGCQSNSGSFNNPVSVLGDERPIPEERVERSALIHFEPGWSLAHQCSCGSRGRYSSSNLKDGRSFEESRYGSGY